MKIALLINGTRSVHTTKKLNQLKFIEIKSIKIFLKLIKSYMPKL